jgi:ribosome maturation factor RimP
MASDAERLWSTCEEYLAAEELELDDLEVIGSGRRTIRITVDAEGGVGVDRLARVSRAMSRFLDEANPIDGAYTLEVTSPGLERRLRRKVHYDKSLGSDVKVKTKVEIDGARSHRGVLESVDETGVVVSIDGEARRIDFEQVQSARTLFEWKRTPKPGSKSG